MKTSLMLASAFAFFAANAADLEMHGNDEWRSVPVERVRLDGPLGRRIALTATNNLPVRVIGGDRAMGKVNLMLGKHVFAAANS